MKARRRSFERARGFTLLEVILGVVIGALLVTMTFRLTSALLELTDSTAREITEERRRSQVEGFVGALFARCHPESQLSLRSEGGELEVLSVVDVDFLYPYQGQLTWQRRFVLGARSRLGGLKDFLFESSAELEEESAGEDLRQLDLLTSLSHLSIEVSRDRGESWQDHWQPEEGWPYFLRLRYQMSGDDRLQERLYYLRNNAFQ